MSACGLDFGTSNTTLGVSRGDVPALCDLEGHHKTVPSAIFFGTDGSSRIGRAAIEAYVEGVDGRLMRGLKSVLGSALIDEATPIGRQRAPFRAVIARFIAEVKARAEAEAGRALTAVVHGRPVHFVDGDAEGDRKAEATLRQIAHEVGFRDVLFQYEPIAAALDYEQHISSEELAIIADIGGGTSDFSIVRISPDRRRAVERAGDILANDGVRIGGTDFDRVLSLRSLMPLLGFRSAMKRDNLEVPSAYFHDLASWHSINRVYEPKVLREIRQVRRDAIEPDRLDRLVQVIEERRGHALAGAVEAAKIDLADAPAARIPLGWMEDGFGVSLTREDLAGNTAELAARIGARMDKILKAAGLAAGQIDALFLTGGSTRLAHVRRAITRALPDAKVVDGDTFGSVGIGLTIEAARRFG
ncbi:Hsp70 family protein [Xanthobacter dioxanivorans]|uniref:Hsp70 family protein n=1 Tax=Xanthobacter dioxanivorans TaxID=2528964 RepID=A0A974PKM3_9HYPH|nr:Hsp70 family protein [Xanthobacter dioxanivorans]QRG04775.1 Hsp70 family protein [Xanthobacter dioxanivorans]